MIAKRCVDRAVKEQGEEAVGDLSVAQEHINEAMKLTEEATRELRKKNSGLKLVDRETEQG